jgi:tetratricopeptide (TPR) repeat protein
MKLPAIVAALLVASAVAVAPGARAQKAAAACPEKPADAGAAKKAAKQWFSAGESMFAVGRYAEALLSFQCSIQMFPHRVTVYNASQAALFAGDKRTALELTEKYLEIAPNGEKAREARKTLVELKVAVGTEEAVAEEEAKKKALTEESAAQQEPEPAPQPVEPQPPEDDGKPLGLAPLIASAAVTAALGVGTIVLDVQVGKRFDEADETGKPSARDGAESLQVVEQVFFGLTLAAAVTTAVLAFFTDFEGESPQDDGAAEAGVAPLAVEGGVGLSLTGRF